MERSTKAGASTPATPRAEQPRHARHRHRSTKAGASTPATPPSEGSVYVWMRNAQRRPGPRPRQHPPRGCSSGRPFGSAQRRPGPRPQQHFQMVQPVAQPSATAQRRPGPRPRQHTHGGRVRAPRQGRSTKAGASTPATQAEYAFATDTITTAQRRPGPRPRQHEGWTAAIRRRAISLNEGRGLDPGNTRILRTPFTASSPLNEGRGLDPGNTASAAASSEALVSAQRRPGPRPRQHMPPASASTSRAVIAQRRPGPRPRQHTTMTGSAAVPLTRSTKAGASTPATRTDQCLPR